MIEAWLSAWQSARRYARSASLLEQMKMLVSGGKVGMIEKAANLVLEKSKDPIEQAKKYLKK
jgi:hypothetical protein